MILGEGIVQTFILMPNLGFTWVILRFLCLSVLWNILFLNYIFQAQGAQTPDSCLDAVLSFHLLQLMLEEKNNKNTPSLILITEGS